MPWCEKAWVRRWRKEVKSDFADIVWLVDRQTNGRLRCWSNQLGVGLINRECIVSATFNDKRLTVNTRIVPFLALASQPWKLLDLGLLEEPYRSACLLLAHFHPRLYQLVVQKDRREDCVFVVPGQSTSRASVHLWKRCRLAYLGVQIQGAWDRERRQNFATRVGKQKRRRPRLVECLIAQQC